MAFGRELQLERERRGVSLEMVAEGTKVAPRYLEALEADRIDSLPGGVFNKGIVRSYCRHLELDEKEWLTRFATSVSAGEEDADWTTFARNVKNTRVRTSAAMRRRWWGVLLMLVVLAALGWAAWRYVLKPRLDAGKPVFRTTAETLAKPSSADGAAGR